MMNLTQPPFDDIHVRKAVNFVINREGMRKAWGGPLDGRARDAHRAGRAARRHAQGLRPLQRKTARATSPRPRPRSSCPSTTRTMTASATPRPARTSSRSPATARVGGGVPARPRAEPEGHRHHAQGSGPQGRVHPDRRAAQEHPVLDPPGLGQGLLRPLRVLRRRTSTAATIIPEGNTNRGLVGITAAQAKKLGVKGNVSDVPSVNKDLDACQQTLGDKRFDVLRGARQEALHRQVVPWVPWLWAATHNLISTERHEVGLRPVLRDHRLRPRGGQVI